MKNKEVWRLALQVLASIITAALTALALQVLASIITAALTALGTTSCMECM